MLAFAKTKCKKNYVANYVCKYTNAKVRLSGECKDSVQKEIQIMQDLEDDLLLIDSLLGNRLLHGGKKSFNKFTEVFNKELNNEISVHARRHDSKMCSVKCTFILHMVEHVSDLLPYAIL